MQLVLVYLKPFWRNLLLKYVLQPKIAKKITKNPYFLEFEVIQDHWSWCQSKGHMGFSISD